MQVFGRSALFVCLAFLSGHICCAQTAGQACIPCHPKEVERFRNSPMGRSVSTEFDEPSGTFHHSPSGATVTAYRNGATLHHKVEEHGLTADYPIACSVGYGKVGRSYLIDIAGHLFQSPASFYTSVGQWNASPGYEGARILDFTRGITGDCVSCHTGSIQKLAKSVALTSLTCERCHGPTEAHLRRPVAGSIVNPARLDVRERDSVCEECHLEGATIVLNPDKQWADFKPGMRLESVETHYVFKNPDGSLPSLPAVSHVEQLAISACARGSGGKLWCGTCHDPHGVSVDRSAQIREICGGCHTTTQLARTHSSGQNDCIGCHMPQRKASDIAHAAITDHRILRTPASGDTQGSRVLSVWRAPSADIAGRNLGLAYFHVARQNGFRTYYQRASDLLAAQTAPRDGEVLAARGYILLGTGNAQAALPLFQAAVKADPNNYEYRLDLGVAYEAAGEMPAAIEYLSHATDLDPYDYRAYKALSDLYRGANQPGRAQETLQAFLKLVPQSLTIRLLQ